VYRTNIIYGAKMELQQELWVTVGPASVLYLPNPPFNRCFLTHLVIQYAIHAQEGFIYEASDEG